MQDNPLQFASPDFKNGYHLGLTVFRIQLEELLQSDFRKKKLTVDLINQIHDILYPICEDVRDEYYFGTGLTQRNSPFIRFNYETNRLEWFKPSKDK